MGEIRWYYPSPLIKAAPQTEKNNVPNGSLPQDHHKFQGYPPHVVVCAPPGYPMVGPVCPPPRSPVFVPVYAPPGSPMFGPVCAPRSLVYGAVYSPQVNSGNGDPNTKTDYLTEAQRKEGPPQFRRVDVPNQASKEKDRKNKDKLIQYHETFRYFLANYKLKFSNLSQENKNIIDNINQIKTEVDKSFQNCIKSFGSDDFKGKYDAYLKKTDKVLMYFDNIEKFVDLISEAKSLQLWINKSNKLDDVDKEIFRSSFKTLFDQSSIISNRNKANQDPTQIYLNAKEAYEKIKGYFEAKTKIIIC